MCFCVWGSLGIRISQWDLAFTDIPESFNLPFEEKAARLQAGALTSWATTASEQERKNLFLCFASVAGERFLLPSQLLWFERFKSKLFSLQKKASIAHYTWFPQVSKRLWAYFKTSTILPYHFTIYHSLLKRNRANPEDSAITETEAWRSMFWQ